jgi:hypothetical protein
MDHAGQGPTGKDPKPLGQALFEKAPGTPAEGLAKQILSLTTLFNKEYNVSVLKEISEIVLFHRLRLRKMRLRREPGSKEGNPFR